MPKYVTGFPHGEELISLKDARRCVPGGVSQSTIYQWVRMGVSSRSTLNREYLEVRIVAGRHYTTKQAIERFLSHFETKGAG